jgi:ABC-type sugar transport system permease subunit
VSPTTAVPSRKYVGLANFDQILHRAYFWGSVRTTLEFTPPMVTIWLGLGVAAALLMNWSFRGRSFVRSGWPSRERCRMCLWS